ncbi:hypothetical protein N7494_011483 [Penicillium frequentans]|uniref:Cell pattern formation-associated protein stuA n=1 Tax=Penicillium frequentans TaxID=3151616 RepID=A0AAD6CJR1_9EURO|nr:hypothetical protein N7494_011483 [Penicillium glabrum]
MSSFNMSNGASRGSYGGYDGINDNGSMMSYQEEYTPQIYRAVYSNVPVYEVEVNGVAVMKRRADSWLNATQILKVAGVVKARRTKTLEKEIAAGEHEKVQGGYGKYQGTWVNYKRGVELCKEYHVEELLRPLLEYDMSPDGSGGPSQGTLDTPTKEQAMAAQRKRLYNGAENRGSSQPQQGTFFQNISRTAATAVNAISKARFDSPGANSRRPSVIRKPSQQMSSQESQMAFSSQQSMYGMSDSGFSSLQNRYLAQDDTDDFAEPPPQTASLNLTPRCPTTPSIKTLISHPPPMEDGQKRGIEALGPATTPEKFQKMKLLMTLFLDKRAKDFTNHPALTQLSGEDLEIPLDEYRNTALHWAAMLARIPLVHALVARGVNIGRVNYVGETALQKSVGTRNNLDYRSFPRLLQVLAPTIDMVDYTGRTILHHIAVMAATGGGGHVSAKHYLESLLEFIVRHGGYLQAPMAIGDTALNLAGRARSVLVPQLLEVGADPHIPNHTGLRPADYGVGVDMVDGHAQSQQAGGRGDTFIDQLAKSKKEIVDATISQISTMVEDALGGIDRELASGLTQKQEKFDHWHGKIRESAKARQIEQKELDELKRKGTERVELERRIKNLHRSSDVLLATLKETEGNNLPTITIVGDADKDSGVDVTAFDALFTETFDSSSGFSEQQLAFLAALPAPDVLKRRLDLYRDFLAEVTDEVENLKAKNAILGQNYRRMVMACTSWTAEQVDDAADGLTQCVKELNDNPVPEDEAIEILMRDRGQDW